MADYTDDEYEHKQLISEDVERQLKLAERKQPITIQQIRIAVKNAMAKDLTKLSNAQARDKRRRDKLAKRKTPEKTVTSATLKVNVQTDTGERVVELPKKGPTPGTSGAPLRFKKKNTVVKAPEPAKKSLEQKKSASAALLKQQLKDIFKNFKGTEEDLANVLEDPELMNLSEEAGRGAEDRDEETE